MDIAKSLMQVLYLFTNSERHQAGLAQSQLQLQRGWGIIGDVNAQPGSPRQVLLTGSPTLAQFQLQPGQLQENIVLSYPVEGWQSGQILQIGSAQIRLTFLCEPCAVLNQIEAHLAKRIQNQRGYLGMVIQTGLIQLGDPVTVLPVGFPALPNSAKGRLVEFLARISMGKVVRTPALILALGLTHSHYRTIPTLLKSMVDLPGYRIVNASGKLFDQHLPNQQAMLESEQVKVIDGQVPEEFS
jgi:alkylated DNA nucleotide flippase Atl1